MWLFIASDFIKAEKQVSNRLFSITGRQKQSYGLWYLYNPQEIVENHAVMVNNFTSCLLNASNLINNNLASNLRVYNTALEQAHDNLKLY